MPPIRSLLRPRAIRPVRGHGAKKPLRQRASAPLPEPGRPLTRLLVSQTVKESERSAEKDRRD